MLAGCTAVPDCRYVDAPVLPEGVEGINAVVQELEQEHRSGTFDGVVTVASGQTVPFIGAYGCADRVRGIRNSPEAISDIGSVAKTFTAAAVLQMVDRQVLQLSSTVGSFFPDAPAQARAITIEQLLSHSSGLDNHHADSDFEAMDKSEAVRRILSMTQRAAPGESLAYSNAAYTLLAAIVEHVSGQSFQDHVYERLIEPLELRHTGFYGDPRLPVGRMSRGYGGDDEGQTTSEKGLSWALVGAGGMVASMEDLLTWAQALKGGKLFSPAARELVFRDANPRWLLGGFAKLDVDGEPIVQIGGSTDYGYTALLQFVPHRDLVVVFLFNAHDKKYRNATHHRLSRQHVLPLLLRGAQ
jgi:CubicO group peptidase (beta-lactamase class C family)